MNMKFTRWVALSLIASLSVLSIACGQPEPVEPETGLGEELEEPVEEGLEDEELEDGEDEDDEDE